MADDMIFTGLSNKPINSVMEHVYVNSMDTVRERSEDIHVRTYVAYGKASDHNLYVDAAYKTQVDQADVEHAFKRGALLIFDGTNYLVPVAMASNKVSTVGGNSSAATLVEWTAKTTA